MIIEPQVCSARVTLCSGLQPDKFIHLQYLKYLKYHLSYWLKCQTPTDRILAEKKPLDLRTAQLPTFKTPA